MSDSELAEHAGYLRDEPKLDAYRTALASLADGRSVLDLGAGSGILGLLAARSGARVVYAVDSGSILGVARDVARRSQLDRQIVHIRGRSTDIELPERVDLAVCDQIGGFVHDAGVLGYFADARRRLLAPDGKLMPAGFRLFLAPAECINVRDQIEMWGSSPAGFDFSPFRAAAVNTEHHVDGNEVRLLAEGVEVAQISSDQTGPITGGGRTVVDVDGRCDGLVGWFEADMGAGVILTNHPTAPGRMDRWCNVYPLGAGTLVERGDAVEVKVDVRPLLRAVTWKVSIEEAGGTRRTSERHSTLLGQFLSPDDLARTGGAPVVATPTGQAVARMLELADGTRSTDDVLAQVRSEGLCAVETPSFEKTLRDALERFSTPIPRGPTDTPR